MSGAGSERMEQCACREPTICFRLKPGLESATNWSPYCFPCQTGNHSHGYGGHESATQHAALLDAAIEILSEAGLDLGDARWFAAARDMRVSLPWFLLDRLRRAITGEGG